MGLWVERGLGSWVLRSRVPIFFKQKKKQVVSASLKHPEFAGNGFDAHSDSPFLLILGS